VTVVTRAKATTVAARCRDCGGSEWTRDGLCRECRAFPTLGFQVADFIESSCVVPDRDQVGEPFVLTDEQLRFLLWFYRVRPSSVFDGRRQLWRQPFVFSRGAQLVRPQKWGKGPFSGAIVCAEAAGPVVFDGWDTGGQPVGRPWATPLIQVTALSEDQTGNVWSALQPMIELGAIAAEIPDTGLTRINLPGGGKIEPVTSSAKSRLGQRLTFLLQDQTESWTKSNGGRSLADNQRRNIAGMGGRWMSTPNAWDPAEESVAQYTSEHEHDGVFHDDVTPPDSLSVRNKRERRKALKLVYGDSWWVDLDRVDAEIEALLPRDPAQAERWFLNRKQAAEGFAFDGAVWDALVSGAPPVEGSLVVLGVDGARFRDALAVIATDVESGLQWPVGIWERPDAAEDDYEHPFDEIDGAVSDVFERFDVWRAYVDPQHIDHMLSKWQGRWGDKKVLPWWTNRPRPVAFAVRSFEEAVAAGEVSHDGDPVFARHVKSCVRMPLRVRDDENRPMHSLQKDRPNSRRKIDAAVAAVLSWEARSDAVAAGATLTPVYRTAAFH
jgi:hypothetical protein